jgi:hypothetical protein
MGTIGDALISAAKTANTYEANFRFSAELAKGLAVGDSFLPVKEFAGGPMSKGVYLQDTEDQSILLAITAVRTYKFLRVILWNSSEGYEPAIAALQQLRLRNVPIFVSLGVQRNALGKRAELFILRDNAAKILDIEPFDDYGGWKNHKVRLELSSPELLHGVGEGFNVKKV